LVGSALGPLLVAMLVITPDPAGGAVSHVGSCPIKPYTSCRLASLAGADLTNADLTRVDPRGAKMRSAVRERSNRTPVLM
jgi:uncharacterized protein YjbI with pentapeptide repeats